MKSCAVSSWTSIWLKRDYSNIGKAALTDHDAMLRQIHFYSAGFPCAVVDWPVFLRSSAYSQDLLSSTLFYRIPDICNLLAQRERSW